MDKTIKSKKPLYKKWWFWVIIAVLVIAIGGAIGDSSSDTQNNQSNQQESTDGRTDLNVGTPAVVDGITVTVDSIKDGITSVGSNILRVSVTYKNNSGKSLSITPYDWEAYSAYGYGVAHVGGEDSFGLHTVADGEEWTGVVSLWDSNNPEKVKFNSSSLDMFEEDSVTWVITKDEK